MINAGRLASVASVVSNPVEPESAFGCSTWNMDEPARSRQNGRTQTPELVTRGLFHTTNATDTGGPFHGVRSAEPCTCKHPARAGSPRTEVPPPI